MASLVLQKGDVARTIILAVCNNCPALIAWRTTCKCLETVVAVHFIEYLTSKRRIRRHQCRFLQSLARRRCPLVASLCVASLRPPAHVWQLEYLDVLEGIHLGDDRFSVCRALAEFIEGSMAKKKKCAPEVLHRSFQVLATIGSKQHPGLLDLFLRHIHFSHREDHGAELWQEPVHHSARDGLVKLAGRGDVALVSTLQSRIGTDKRESSRNRVQMIVALGRMAKVGDAAVVSFLLKLLPTWREAHSRKVASAARSAVLDVMHASDQSAMKRCLQDWDEPNIHEFVTAAIRDAVKDGELQGIEYGEDPEPREDKCTSQ